MKEILIQDFWIILKIILKIVTVTIPLILTIAYLTYAERKIIAFVQLRKGPNVVGPFGLLQPIADAMKLIFKEYIIPANSSKLIFFIAPMITFILSLVGWAVIPFSAQYVLANINVGILYLLAISSMNVYGIIMAGWSSNSKYAFLGAIRSSAQMISYEISIGFAIISVLLTCGSLNLTDIVLSYATRPLYVKIMLIPMMVVYFVSILAETNRAPFDLPEAEGELVAGYNVEYSSTSFALFFLGEYGNMILGSAVCSILFMGGWLPIIDCEWLSFVPGIVWMSGKVCFLLFMFLIIRAIVPRYRYDQLMHLGWKIFMPLSLLWVIIIASLLFYNNDLPV